VTTIITSSGPLTQSERVRLGSVGLITSSIGRVATLQIPADRIQEALRLSFVSGAYSPRIFHPTLDASAREIGAAFVWQNVTDPNSVPVDGSGVLIGIVDTGVDLSHPDLRFENGTSKVLYLWDQTGSGTPPRGFSYGVECSWGQINEEKCAEKDTFGHGTHVASIAASSGLATGNYRGIAPGASLLIVKSGRPICDGDSWTFDENAIIDGLAYLAERARALGMRLVVNLSLGGNIGGHDDTSPLELALDDLSARGIVVTVSAGNEAENRGHATGLLGPAATTSVNWELNGRATNAIAELWYPNDKAVSVTLVTPSKERVQGPTTADGIETSDGLITIISSKSAKGNQWTALVESEDELKTSRWSLVVSVTGEGSSLGWDAYVDSNSCSYPPATFSAGDGYTVDKSGTISVPATASGVIAVGAYVSKNAWPNRLGGLVYLSDYKVGEIASFSSRGPTRDGRTKPEISAPGLFITAARSSKVSPGESDPDDYHRVLAGTSMAAPHVAGVVALMLQYNPQLTPQQIRSLLTDGAYLDQFTGFIQTPEGSNDWGWGKADARTATGLFRVSSLLALLPPEFYVSLFIDGKFHGLLGGAQILTLRFTTGQVHTFQVSGQIFTANKTRYAVAEDRAAFSANGAFAPDVHVQYLLSLESSHGQVEGEGWYDAGSYPRYAVNPLVTSSGIDQLVGVGFVFDYWIDEQQNKISPGSLVIDSPRRLTAVWKAQLMDLRPAVLLALIAVFLIFVVRHRRQRSQACWSPA